MDQPLLVIIGLLLFLMLLGSPVIFAIGFAGLSYFFIKPGMTGMLDIYAHKFFTGMDVFIWLSIPLFIIAERDHERHRHDRAAGQSLPADGGASARRTGLCERRRIDVVFRCFGVSAR